MTNFIINMIKKSIGNVIMTIFFFSLLMSVVFKFEKFDDYFLYSLTAALISMLIIALFGKKFVQMKKTVHTEDILLPSRRNLNIMVFFVMVIAFVLSSFFLAITRNMIIVRFGLESDRTYINVILGMLVIFFTFFIAYSFYKNYIYEEPKDTIEPELYRKTKDF